MRGLLLAFILLGAMIAPSSSAAILDDATDCAPPCGPIPVIITIVLDKSRNVEFDEGGRFTATGKVQFYFDIDDNGYAWDPNPQEEVWVNLKVAKAPNWTSTTIEPTKFRVPIRPFDEATKACADCVRPEGDPPQMQFLYEHPLTVTVEKTRDFDAAELKRWLKSDGTYRVTINAISNDSFLGHPSVGEPAGLQEGYGVKEIRFTAPKDLVPGSVPTQDAGANAPGVELLGLLGALGAAIAVWRRRE